MKIRHGIIPCVAAGLALVAAAPALAADTSAWSQDTKSAVRLIAGANTKGAPLRAGIEIKMQPGWHTYWRYPGDSGVPPRFSFAGSDNVKSATVRFPAPLLFSDGGGQSIGYNDSVIFPVTIVPNDPAKPVIARLKIEYAVCEKLCVPAEGKAELPVGAAPSTQDAALKEAEARVPQQVTAAALGLSVRRVNDAAKPLVALDLKAAGDKPMQVFAEGPSPDWALPIPKPAQGAPAGRRHFGFELDGLPPGANPQTAYNLTFTVVEGDRAYEVTTRLD
ncbi:protein-disulfide reductase DsbD domain-containing protein [Undibacter mobilis]|uniref:Cytochrome C biogenesis protein n=1 Tax=Undibacter mobilis TaxID=2292256 RepID=A0A371BDK8_9BRAD|nr:protein-disulfide reductase DsbD domain-containing protein [Undibacter mobilis]RDV05638.1 cytochrome C biogenesis protein [Undibacter mobilis]